MKKLNLKSYLTGVISTILVTALILSVSAAAITKTLNATYKDIKISVNGNTITPKDATGKVVEPFIVDGSTYLPVRSVAEAVGYEVEWDSATSTAKLTRDFIMVDPIRLAVEETFVNIMAEIGLQKDLSEAYYKYAQAISSVEDRKKFKDTLTGTENIFNPYEEDIKKIEERINNPNLSKESYKEELNNLKELKKKLEDLSEKTILFNSALYNFADIYDNKTVQQLISSYDDLKQVSTDLYTFSFKVQGELFQKLEKDS